MWIYYYCHSCGIELCDEDCDQIKYSGTYANGENGYCPECNRENSIETDEE